MSESNNHFNENRQQELFEKLLKKYPYLETFWDFEKRNLDIPRLKTSMGSFSHGEKIMASFLAGIWTGNNILEFDFFEAVAVLDSEHIKVITSYAHMPIHP